MSTGRVYAGETAADRDARRRRQLLDAGLDIFGEIGFAAATVRGICREAKVADRNFYEYFPTTEDLLVAVYDECTDRLEEAATTAALAALGDVDLADATPERVAAMARAGLDAFLGAVEADPRLARVVWVEVLGVSPRVEATYLARIERFAAMLLALSPAAASESAPGGGSSATALRHRLLSLTAVGGVSQLVVSWVVGGLEAERGELVDVLVEHLGAVAGLLVPAALPPA